MCLIQSLVSSPQFLSFFQQQLVGACCRYHSVQGLQTYFCCPMAAHSSSGPLPLQFSHWSSDSSGHLVSEDCLCPPSLVFLMSKTMLVCLHISHIDAFHVPVAEIETMVVCSVSVLCLVAVLPLRMCTPDQLFLLIPGSLLPPILLWARPEPVSFPSQCHSYISGGVQVN